MSIVGAEEFNTGKAKKITGFKAVDKYTVQIDLKNPDATLLAALSMPFTAVVPKEWVQKWGRQFVRHPLGTGPYMMDHWTSGQELVLVRNPNWHYWRDDGGDQAWVDGFKFLFSVTPTRALLLLKRGQNDVLGSYIASSDYVSVTTDPVWKKQVAEQPAIAIDYLFMNVQMKPFDNLKVRQAVAWAIDREKLLKLISGAGSPLNQIFPAGLPGHVDGSAGDFYGYDPAKAKQLLAEAGYPNGFSTTLYSHNVDPWPKVIQSIQNDLAQVGIKAGVKLLAMDTYWTLIGIPKKTPMGLQDWWQDFPDPSDFVLPLFSKSNAIENGANPSYWWDPTVEAQLTQSFAMTDTAQRLALFQTMQKEIMDQAPAVPLFQPNVNSVFSSACAAGTCRRSGSSTSSTTGSSRESESDYEPESDQGPESGNEPGRSREEGRVSRPSLDELVAQAEQSELFTAPRLEADVARFLRRARRTAGRAGARGAPARLRDRVLRRQRRLLVGDVLGQVPGRPLHLRCRLSSSTPTSSAGARRDAWGRKLSSSSPPTPARPRTRSRPSSAPGAPARTRWRWSRAPTTPLAHGADEVVAYGSSALYTLPALAASLFVIEFARAGDLDAPTARALDELRAGVEALPAIIGRAYRDEKARCEELARAFLPSDLLYCVGAGPNYGLAYKFALTVFMENIRTHGSVVESAEFRHGPAEMLERQRADMVFLLGSDESRAMTERSLAFARERGARTIVFDAAGYEGLHPLLAPYVLKVPLQWFVVYSALLRGILDLDERVYMGHRVLSDGQAGWP